MVETQAFKHHGERSIGQISAAILGENGPHDGQTYQVHPEDG